MNKLTIILQLLWACTKFDNYLLWFLVIAQIRTTILKAYDWPVAGGRGNWKNVVDDSMHEVPPEFAQPFGCKDGFLVRNSQQIAQLRGVIFYVRYFGFHEIGVFAQSSLALFQNFVFWANFL